jgi:thiamine biosynthesis lipoprotein
MPKRPGSPVHRFAHEAMATVFELFVAGRDETYARQASRAAFDEIDRIERLFSRFDPSSEVSRISRMAPGETMRIGIETFECLSLAARIQAETHGAFDINFRAREAGPGKSARASSGCLRLKKTRAGFEAERRDGRAAKGPALLDLDLGGVGKGYALDKARETLEDWSIGNALLHSGTSTALGIGPGPGARGAGWPVGAATAWNCPGAPQKIRLRGGALSGSGVEVKGPHIIDPRDGRPARRHLAAWAFHRSAAVADALSTAFFVMTTREVESYCGERPDVWALVIIGEKKCKMFNAALII